MKLLDAKEPSKGQRGQYNYAAEYNHFEEVASAGSSVK